MRGIAQDLEGARLTPEQLPDRLNRDLAKAPDAFRLGVVFRPEALGGGRRLRAPFARREGGVVKLYGLEETQDYTQEDWYFEGLSRDGWGEPHQSRTTRRLVVGYNTRFRLPGAGAPSGMVRIDFTTDNLASILAANALGDAAYTSLVSARAVYMVHPRADWADGRRDLFQSAEELSDRPTAHAGEWAILGARGEVEGLSYTGTQTVLRFVEPVPASRWSVNVCLFRGGAMTGEVGVRRSLFWLVLLALTMVGCLGGHALDVAGGEPEDLWRWQVLVASLLATGTLLLWGLTLVLPDPPADRATPILGQENLDRLLERSGNLEGTRRWKVPVGLNLETVRFVSANDILVKGRAWMAYPAGCPKEARRGFTLPEAEDVSVEEVFQRVEGDAEIREYTFKADLRQEFPDTFKYPFDQAVLHLRIHPVDFTQPVILVPDLSAYRVLSPTALPGVRKDLILTGWNKERSYFGYLPEASTTTFGVAEARGAPSGDLSFQLVLSRKFLDPFISALLPVIVVACLLFTLLLACTKDPSRKFKVTDVLPATAALLFPVIYAQIGLRTRVSASGLLYLEYLYFLLYAVILLVAANALAFILGKGGPLIQDQDNGKVKLLYWPVMLGGCFWITYFFLY